MRKDAGYTKCDICGIEVRARGIAGHKSLKHGVVEKKIIVSTTITAAKEVSLLHEEKNPSVYVKKNEEVIGLTRHDLYDFLKLARQSQTNPAIPSFSFMLEQRHWEQYPFLKDYHYLLMFQNINSRDKYILCLDCTVLKCYKIKGAYTLEVENENIEFYCLAIDPTRTADKKSA